MRVDFQAVLRAHPFLHTERPPELWEADADDETFFPLLGEMIAAGLARNGGDLGRLTLNVSNVTVEPTAAGLVLAGDYVAITIRGRGDFGPETTWSPDRADAPILVSPDLGAAAHAAGARLGYTRVLAAGEGSITVFFRRRP